MLYKPQAIAGVSATAESVMMVVHPSVAATGLGRLLGRMCEAIPLRIGAVNLLAILLAPLVAPLAAFEYLRLKAFGQRYVLTNRRLRILGALTRRSYGEAALTEIGDVAVDFQPGQSFYKAADLVVLGTGGNTLLRLPGVVRPDVFRQTILKACAARTQTEGALAVIRSRAAAAAR